MWELQRVQEAAAAVNRLAEAKLDIPQHIVGETCHRLVQFLRSDQGAMGVVPCVSLLQSLPLRPDGLKRACYALLEYVDRVRPEELTDVVALLLDSSLGADTALVADVWLTAAAMSVQHGHYRTAAELLSLPGTAAAMPGVASSHWAPRLRLLAMRLCQKRGQILTNGALSLGHTGRRFGPLSRHRGVWDAKASVMRVVTEAEADATAGVTGAVIVPNDAAVLARAPATLAEIDMVADALGAAVLEATEACCQLAADQVSAADGTEQSESSAFRPAVMLVAAEPSRKVSSQEADLAVWEALRAELCLGRPLLQVRAAPSQRRARSDAASQSEAEAEAESQPPAPLGLASKSEQGSAGAPRASAKWALNPAVSAVVQRLKPLLVYASIAWHAATPPADVEAGFKARHGSGTKAAGAGNAADASSAVRVALQGADVGSPPRAIGFWNTRGASLKLGRLLGWQQGEDAACILLIEALETGDEGAWEGYVAALEAVAGDAVVLETRLRQIGRRIERTAQADPSRQLWRQAASPCAVDVVLPGIDEAAGVSAARVTGFSPISTVPPATSAAALPPRHSAEPRNVPLSDSESLSLGTFTAEAGALRVLFRVAAALRANPSGPASAADWLCEAIRRLQAAELPVGEETVRVALAAAMARGAGSSAIVPLAERGMAAAVADASYDMVQTAALSARIVAAEASAGAGLDPASSAGAASDSSSPARGFVVAEGHVVELAVAGALQSLAPLAAEGMLAGLLLCHEETATAAAGASGRLRPATDPSLTAVGRAESTATLLGVIRSSASPPSVEAIFHPLSVGGKPLARSALQSIHRLLTMSHSRVSGPPSSSVSDFVWAGCVVLARSGSLVYARDGINTSAAELDAEFQKLVRHAQAGRLRSLTPGGISAAVMGLLSTGDAAGAGQVLSLANASSLRLPTSVWQASACVAARRDGHAALLHVLNSADDAAFRMPSPSREQALPSPPLASSSDISELETALTSASRMGLFSRIGLPSWHSEDAIKQTLDPWRTHLGPAAWASYFTRAELHALAVSADARGMAKAAERIRAIVEAQQAGPAARHRNPMLDTLTPAPMDEDSGDAALAAWTDAYLAGLQSLSDQPQRARVSEHHSKGFWAAFEAETRIGRGTLAESIEMASAAAMAEVTGDAKFFNTQGLLKSLQSGWLPKDSEMVGGMPRTTAAETIRSVLASVNAVLPPALRVFQRRPKSDKPRAEMQAARDALRLLCRHTSQHFGTPRRQKRSKE